MIRTPVKSSNIRSVGYDAAPQTLEIEFTSGTLYQYAKVPAEKHTGLMAAESVGRYFGTEIRGKYDATKVEQPK
ncbi:MAG: KTSC domain-containing protein [Solimonas sp.]